MGYLRKIKGKSRLEMHRYSLLQSHPQDLNGMFRIPRR
jgi:hypothetical protein